MNARASVCVASVNDRSVVQVDSVAVDNMQSDRLTWHGRPLAPTVNDMAEVACRVDDVDRC